MQSSEAFTRFVTIMILMMITTRVSDDDQKVHNDVIGKSTGTLSLSLSLSDADDGTDYGEGEGPAVNQGARPRTGPGNRKLSHCNV